MRRCTYLDYWDKEVKFSLGSKSLSFHFINAERNIAACEVSIDKVFPPGEPYTDYGHSHLPVYALQVDLKVSCRQKENIGQWSYGAWRPKLYIGYMLSGNNDLSGVFADAQGCLPRKLVYIV